LLHLSGNSGIFQDNRPPGYYRPGKKYKNGCNTVSPETSINNKIFYLFINTIIK